MLRTTILIFILFLLSATVSQKSSVDYKVRAKRIADSIIQTYIDKQTFDKFYRFDNRSSELGFTSAHDKPWTEKTTLIPNEYSLSYSLKNCPTINNAMTTIYLDSTLKLIDISNLIDHTYLKQFIRKKEFKKIKTQLGYKDAWTEWIFYDSIPGKKTVKPFIEIRKFVRTTYALDGQCLFNVDSCLALDPYNGTLLKWYYDERSECF